MDGAVNLQGGRVHCWVRRRSTLWMARSTCEGGANCCQDRLLPVGARRGSPGPLHWGVPPLPPRPVSSPTKPTMRPGVSCMRVRSASPPPPTNPTMRPGVSCMRVRSASSSSRTLRCLA